MLQYQVQKLFRVKLDEMIMYYELEGMRKKDIMALRYYMAFTWRD